MNVALANWKTTLVGAAAAVLLIVSSAYKPGMTWRDWGTAVAVLLLGALAHDGHS